MIAAARYPHLLRTDELRWWRPVAGLALFLATMFTIGFLVVLLVSAVSYLAGLESEPIFEVEAYGRPLGLLANNLILAAAIPAAVVTVSVVHRERPGWLASVTGRTRWGLLARFTVLAVLVVLVFFGVSFLLPEVEGAEADGTGPSSATIAGLLLVIALTTPLQAAAEEVGFRGYLSQAVASYARSPVVGAVAAAGVSALLFALAHGTQDGWLFSDRFAFGLVASWLVWRTGGLEAAVALHVVNNVVSLAVAAVTGTLEDAITVSTLAWEYAVVDVAMMVTFALVADRLTRRWRVQVRRPERSAALSGSREVGYPGSRTPASPPAGGEHPWGMG